VPGEPDGGGTGRDHRAGDDDDNPGCVDDLPEPRGYVVIVHGASLPRGPPAGLSGVGVCWLSLAAARHGAEDDFGPEPDDNQIGGHVPGDY
jgi:hypothetical protein